MSVRQTSQLEYGSPRIMGASLENRGECGRIDGNYRYKLALSREVLPSSECLDVVDRGRDEWSVIGPVGKNESDETTRILWNLRKSPEITRVWVLQGHQEVGTTT